MLLCNNRPEGFGPHSYLHPDVPTTCFLDVIVEPLATWVFLLLVMPASLTYLLQQQRRIKLEMSDAAKGATTRRKVGTIIANVLYSFLLVAMLAMQALEIARLARAELGIGLLPFTFVGLLVAAVNMVYWAGGLAHTVNVAYWAMLTVVLSLKVAAVQEEQEVPATRRTLSDGVLGNYPTSDQALDNAVMVGVVVVLGILDLICMRR